VAGSPFCGRAAAPLHSGTQTIEYALYFLWDRPQSMLKRRPNREASNRCQSGVRYDCVVTSSDTSASPKRARLKAEDRKMQIIEAARRVYAEQGGSGAKSRLIAERAGITEAYLYRHFHSKEELYELAVEAPLRALVFRLRADTHELAQREDVGRLEVLFHTHELVLGFMVDIAPLLMPALFGEPRPGEKSFYSDYLLPNLRSAIAVIIPDITGFPVEEFDLDLFVESLIGIHLTLALEGLLEREPVDVPAVARQLTEMFGRGVRRGALRRASDKNGQATPAKPATSAPRATVSSAGGAPPAQPVGRRRG
jgi:TetR/AcrR family transcriptional regulator